MKFCDPHYEWMRKAIADRGMAHLVSMDHRQVMEMFRQEVERGLSPEHYDPLMGISFMICNNAVNVGGGYLLTGDYCPLCELVKNTQEEGQIDQTWINAAADVARSEAVLYGRLPE